MRECDGCTVCCLLFPVDYLGKPANTECEFCDGGCTIQETKPQGCKDFNCAYVQSNAPVELRPDHCGIVFEKLSDSLFYGTVWKPITEAGERQIHAFRDQGFSVVLSSSKGGSTRAYPAPSRDEEEVLVEFNQHLEARYGHLRH